MTTDLYNDIPVLTPEFREVDHHSRLLLKNKDGEVVGQLYTSDIKYEKPVSDRGRFWIGVFSDGESVLSGLTF